MIYTWTGAKVKKIKWENRNHDLTRCDVDFEDGKPIVKNRQYYLKELKADNGLKEILDALN